MDWTNIGANSILTLIGSGLTALIIGVWKPWAGAYTGEKGKNLARKEDLNEILAEVRAVTIAQKEIESKLAGDLWSKQMVWTQKKSMYGEIITLIHELVSACTRVRQGLEAKGDYKIFTIATNDFTELYTQLVRQAALAAIFLHKDATSAIFSYCGNMSHVKMGALEWPDHQLKLLTSLNSSLVVSARTDLGFDFGSHIWPTSAFGLTHGLDPEKRI